MTAQSESCQFSAFELWRSLATVAVAACLCLEICQISDRLGTWSLSSDWYEIALEAALRLLMGATLGLAAATAFAAVGTLILLLGSSHCRQARARQLISFVSVVAAIANFGYILWTLSRWCKHLFVELPTMNPAIVAALGVLYGVAVVGLLMVRRVRSRVICALEPVSDPVTSRRSAILVTVAAAIVIGAELSVIRHAPRPSVRPRAIRASSPPNIILITLDALSAEELPIYGYSRPTTPALDEFARCASIFESYFAVGTFTTPNIATMMSGRYPSENHVVNFQDKLRGPGRGDLFPELLRNAGYRLGASISNPAAFGLAQQLEEYFDFLPDQPRRQDSLAALWRGARLAHPRGAGGLMAEMMESEAGFNFLPDLLEAVIPSQFGRTESQHHPRQAFEEGLRLLECLTSPFFLWVHAFAPHGPYLPGAPFLGRFGSSDKMRTDQQQRRFVTNLDHWYSPQQQESVDQTRIRYDEWLAETDQALGDFLKRSAKLRFTNNTAVLISADHGESFTGGVAEHGSPCLTRPQLHIPLLIRMPFQTRQSRIQFTADQTSLVPTMLEIAGVTPSAGMGAPSLLPWCGRDGAGTGDGVAFAEHLYGNPCAGPYRQGSAGIIAAGQQYYVRLETGKEFLRPLSEAHMAYLDRSAENPSLAKAMRARLFGRFPELRPKVG